MSTLTYTVQRPRVASTVRYRATEEARRMTDPLERLRARKALLDRLVAERDATLARAEELTAQVATVQEDVRSDAVAAYDQGVTPKVIDDVSGVTRSVLHHQRKKGRN